MSQLLVRPKLWNYKEAAEIFGLPANDGFRTIRTLVRLHGLTPKRTGHPTGKGLDQADLEVLAGLLNLTITWPDKDH